MTEQHSLSFEVWQGEAKRRDAICQSAAITSRVSGCPCSTCCVGCGGHVEVHVRGGVGAERNRLVGVCSAVVNGVLPVRVMRGVARAREQIDGGGVFELSSELGGGVACATRSEVYEGWIAEWGLRPGAGSAYRGGCSTDARGDPSMGERVREVSWDLWGVDGLDESGGWINWLVSTGYTCMEVEP